MMFQQCAPTQQAHDVLSTSMRRNDVTSTSGLPYEVIVLLTSILISTSFDVVCPLGTQKCQFGFFDSHLPTNKFISQALLNFS